MSLHQQLVTDKACPLPLPLSFLECRQNRLASVLSFFGNLLGDAKPLPSYLGTSQSDNLPLLEARELGYDWSTLAVKPLPHPMHSFEPDIVSDTELVSEELLDCCIAILVVCCFWDGVKQQVVSQAAPRQVDQRIVVGLRFPLLLDVVTAQLSHPRPQIHVLPLQFRDALMAEHEGLRQIRHLND